MLFRPPSDPHIHAIADRVRAIVSRLSGHNLTVVAETLRVPVKGLTRLMDNRERTVDIAFLIDVIAALVYESGVDPQWLLTGEYDATAHRDALLLGEDRSANGVKAMREFIHQQYRQLRRDALFAWLPRRRTARSSVEKTPQDGIRP